MKNIAKKLVTITLLISTFGLLEAGRGSHGGRGSGRHAGVHHGGGHHPGGHHPGGHHGAGHHGGQHGYHHAGQYYHGGGYYGRGGWGGYGAGLAAGLVGAAIIGGVFYYNGYPLSYWQANDPVIYGEAMDAYNQYQADPSSVPVRDDLAGNQAQIIEVN